MAKKEEKTKESIIKQLEIHLDAIHYGRTSFCILGRTPLVCEALNPVFSLFPERRDKTKLKHSVWYEYRKSVYAMNRGAETYIGVKPQCFKKATCAVVLDTPTRIVSKAQAERCLKSPGTLIPVWGIPELYMDNVKEGGVKKSHDVRTRAMIKEWATVVTLEYEMPVFNETVVTKALALAGEKNGIGGYRQQKGGGGSYGSFEIVNPEDKRFQEIVKRGGRDVQIAAINNPELATAQSEFLLDYYTKKLEEYGYDRDEIFMEGWVNADTEQKRSRKAA